MPLADPTDLPSLDFLFGKNERLMKVFKQAQITSVAPLMLLSRQILVNDIPGIGDSTSTYIARVLAEHGLPQRQFSDKLRDYIDERFGALEFAPITALSVVVIRDTVVTRPRYAPLQLIQLLNEINPHMQIADLLNTPGRGLIRMVEGHIVFGPVLERLTEDLTEINHRLTRWDPNICIGLHWYRATSLNA